MTPAEAAAFLRRYNEWRRTDDRYGMPYPDPREIGEANGWKRLLSNSAKIVNILGGYGYQPALASMEQCVESACTGRIVQ